MAGFISSPVFGKYGSKISPGYVYNPSAFLISVCTLAFGYLSYVENLTLFLGLAYALRIFSGMAIAAAWSSLLAALITFFPNHVSKLVATSEVCYGIGYMLGPAFGALLYSTGGFALPFEITGSIAILVSILILVTIPKIDVLPEDGGNGSKFGSVVQLIKMPSVILPLIDKCVCNSGISMSEAMVALYLESIGADTNVIGIAFFLCVCCWMLGAAVSGYITDKLLYPTTLSILGLSLIHISEPTRPY